ncbi:hypothetical protein [Streptomyces sp. JJ66]|uniref:hypothetical protein n=1 Tax=Streptomyces sp. JJ66 TaxID=2803843 RepID=UPI00214B8D76|nr:hypothetical protein [Streptomyces sp. JJ66]
MTPPAPTKSHTTTPNQPHTAQAAEPAPAVGARKTVGRKAVPSALRPDPHPGDGRYPVAWLRITAPGRDATPTAVSWCRCGRQEHAAGRARVLALAADHAAHREVCPLRAAPARGAAA